MTFRRMLAAAAVVVALGLAGAAAAQQSYQVVGKIEKVDKDGRIHVDGYRILVNDRSEVFDHHYRPASPRELVPGIDVEVTCVESPLGTHAQRVIATMMR